MQLQQSSFQLSRTILTKIPKPALILSSIILFTIIITNLFLMLSSKPELVLDKCWSKYYSMTHTNITQYLIQEVNNNKTSTVTQIDSMVKFINETTIVLVETSQDMGSKDQCQINLNYKSQSQKQKKSQQQNNRKNIKMAWLLSNYALYFVNFTNPSYTDKHPVQYHKIILPKIYSGYRYLGMNTLVNSVQDFLYVALKGFVTYQRQLRQRWVEQYIKLIEYIKQQQTYQKQIINKMKQQNITDNSNTQKALQATSLQQNKKQDLKSLFISQSQQISTKQNIIQAENSSDTTIAKLNQSLIQTQHRIQLLKIQLSTLNIYFNPYTLQNSYAKHRVLYRMQQSDSWYTMLLQSSLPPIQTSILWSNIGKLFYSLLKFSLMFVTSYFVAIFVRYTYIVIMTIINMITGNKCVNYAGWMSRYTSIYNTTNASNQQNKKTKLKLKLQITFSFIGMYTLFSTMSYFLAQILASILVSVQPTMIHPIYYENLLTTFLVVQIFHYIFFRTRVTLVYFSKFSILITLTCLMITSYHPFYMTSYMIHNHLLVTLFMICCFLFLEKLVSQEELQTGHRPNIDKPRMLYYLGYDIDWHKGIPPIWTMFQPWYDISFVNEQERSYIDQNYELLYGKLLGVNQPQQLPDEEDENQQAISFKQIQMSQAD